MRGHTLAILAVATLGLAGAITARAQQTEEPDHAAPAAPAATGAAQDILDMLDTLLVTARPDARDSTYRRDAFGPAWSDIDENGCNQRDDVLLRDAVPGSVTTAQQGACDHDVIAGTWIDPYTGTTITLTNAKEPKQAQAVQIDHIVPLAEAHRSGAAAWTDGQRLQFAGTLENLLAVDGPTNASKSDDDPAAWRPRQAFQCTYATRWITTKAQFSLTIDAPEKAALTEMLGTCQN